MIVYYIHADKMYFWKKDVSIFFKEVSRKIRDRKHTM
jgi:hypothetical protein